MSSELTQNPYKYSDNIIKAFHKVWVISFKKIKKSIMKFDEINDLKAVTKIVEETYDDMDKTAQKYFKKIANHYCDDFEEFLLLDYLSTPSPITKYAYTKEVKRKAERLIEALIASKDKQEREQEVSKAERYWSREIDQYVVEITDLARLEQLRKQGFKKVRWVTLVDERRCAICRARHNQVYDIDKVPTKPHWNCRCYLVAYRVRYVPRNKR